MFTALKALLIRTTSSGTMGLTVYGFLITFVALSVALYGVKSKLEDYWEARDESRKVEAVIESNARTVPPFSDTNTLPSVEKRTKVGKSRPEKTTSSIKLEGRPTA